MLNQSDSFSRFWAKTCLSGLLFFWCSPATARIADGNDLMRECEPGLFSGESASCDAYIVGVTDGFMFSVLHSIGGIGQGIEHASSLANRTGDLDAFCVDETSDGKDAVMAVRSYLDDLPERELSRSAAALIIEALKKNLPCGAAQSVP